MEQESSVGCALGITRWETHLPVLPQMAIFCLAAIDSDMFLRTGLAGLKGLWGISIG